MNNLDLMRARLEYNGGIRQEDRMIKAKRRTLDKAVLYSYQGCDIAKIPHQLTVLEAREQLNGSLTKEEQSQKTLLELESTHYRRALINPDKIKEDYDEKILSIPYECGIHPGDIIQWRETNTYWISYLPQLTEDAYYRSGLRRCRYQITWKDEDGKIHRTWAAIRGPVETKINTISKGGLMTDTPNLTLNILVPRTEATLAAFKRYSRFIFADLCWEVQASDTISIEGTLEINAMENYINKHEDDQENDIVNGLIISPIESEDPEGEVYISGKSIIEPGFEYEYTIVGADNGSWLVDNDCPMVEVIEMDVDSIKVKWKNYKSGRFKLLYETEFTTLEKLIIVESLF